MQYKVETKDGKPNVDFNSPEVQRELQKVKKEIEQVMADSEPILHAIPPKEADVDLWDEAEKGVRALQPDQPYGAYSYTVILEYLRTHYSLTPKK
jgi:hypothetical protein